jgi:hypothetical protein
VAVVGFVLAAKQATAVDLFRQDSLFDLTEKEKGTLLYIDNGKGKRGHCYRKGNIAIY